MPSSWIMSFSVTRHISTKSSQCTLTTGDFGPLTSWTRCWRSPLHSPKVTCWCAMTASGLGRPGFFEASNGTTAAVNKDRYVGILEKLWLIMAENTGLNTDTMWSQQDRAPANASIIDLSWLEDHFGERVINMKTRNP